ncbi:MAG: protein kinase [Thermogemmata sp.]|mgnify:FL=1
MTAPIHVAEFVRLIQQSGVADERAIRNHLTGLGIDLEEGDARSVAEILVRDGLLTQFQADQLLQGKWRGFHVGKYRILERIGSGGMGQVFLCRHIQLPSLIAMKVLPPSKASSPSALGRFYREARAAASLDHPHLVRTHDIGQDGELHYIIMEYIHGPNLLDVVKKSGPLSIERTVTYLYHIADALDYAHKKGLVHRDIKPSNILIDRYGRAKLLDLGLARFCHDEEDNLTVMYDDKMVLGTADYVAPEQIANSHHADIRADIYSLGATAYYLLAGHPIFPTGTVSQKLIWHGTKEPAPIRQIRPDVPEELAAVVMRMLAKEARQRYQTPAELQAALLPLLPLDPPALPVEEMPRYSPLVMRLLGEAGVPNPNLVRTPPPRHRGTIHPAAVKEAVAQAACPPKLWHQAAVATVPPPGIMTTPPPVATTRDGTLRSNLDTDRAALDQTPCAYRQPSPPAPRTSGPQPPTAPDSRLETAETPAVVSRSKTSRRWIRLLLFILLFLSIAGGALAAWGFCF